MIRIFPTSWPELDFANMAPTAERQADCWGHDQAQSVPFGVWRRSNGKLIVFPLGWKDLYPLGCLAAFRSVEADVKVPASGVLIGRFNLQGSMNEGDVPTSGRAPVFGRALEITEGAGRSPDDQPLIRDAY